MDSVTNVTSLNSEITENVTSEVIDVTMTDATMTDSCGYRFQEAELTEDLIESLHHTTGLRTRCQNKADSDEWIRTYSAATKTTWRVASVVLSKQTQRKNAVKAEYCCVHHKSREKNLKKGPIKSLNCRATLHVTIKLVNSLCQKEIERIGGDVATYPCIIHRRSAHSHPIDYDSGILKYRDVGPEAIERFTALFKQNYTPACAMSVCKYELKTALGDGYADVENDRAILPDMSYLYRLQARIRGDSKPKTKHQKRKRKLDKGKRTKKKSRKFESLQNEVTEIAVTNLISEQSIANSDIFLNLNEKHTNNVDTLHSTEQSNLMYEINEFNLLQNNIDSNNPPTDAHNNNNTLSQRTKQKYRNLSQSNSEYNIHNFTNNIDTTIHSLSQRTKKRYPNKRSTSHPEYVLNPSTGLMERITEHTTDVPHHVCVICAMTKRTFNGDVMKLAECTLRNGGP